MKQVKTPYDSKHFGKRIATPVCALVRNDNLLTIGSLLILCFDDLGIS